MYSPDKYPSPTGQYVFQIAASEVRMSHWIESFTLVEAASGEIVLRLRDTDWSLDTAQWLSDSLVKMKLRKYPGDHTPSSFEVQIDCEARTAQVAGEPEMPVVPLRKLEQTLERLYAAGKAAARA